jgi:hypothetical protein
VWDDAERLMEGIPRGAVTGVSEKNVGSRWLEMPICNALGQAGAGWWGRQGQRAACED